MRAYGALPPVGHEWELGKTAEEIRMKEPIVQSAEEIGKILRRISFKNTAIDFKWEFHISDEVKHGDRVGWLVWCSFERPDTQTGTIGRGRGSGRNHLEVYDFVGRGENCLGVSGIARQT